MLNQTRIISTLVFILVAAVTMPLSVTAQQKMPAEKAGTIGQPTGQLAFIREGNIYVMEANGSKQDMICESVNANGKLSWSPDNKTIIFTRSGEVNVRNPNNLGGMHKLYDLFFCYIDSAYANKRYFWLQLTDDVGSRYPEWNKDGKITFYKDIYANNVNAAQPNYQICTINEDGNYETYVRKDWQNMYEDFLITPSRNDAGDIAATFFEKGRSLGLVVLKNGKYQVSMDSLKAIAKTNKGKIAPAWSPDGKWIACIDNKLSGSGIYIMSPDFKETYLVTMAPVGTYLNTVAPSWSPDGKWLTFSTADGSVWIVDITGNGLRRMTGPGLDKFPAWSK